MPIKDVQGWGMLKPKLDVCGYRGKRKGPNADFFATFFAIFLVFLCFFALCSFILSALSLFCMLSKRDNHNFKKNEGKNDKCKNASHTRQFHLFIWIKKGGNKLNMTKKSCRACSIRLVQLNHIL